MKNMSPANENATIVANTPMNVENSEEIIGVNVDTINKSIADKYTASRSIVDKSTINKSLVNKSYIRRIISRTNDRPDNITDSLKSIPPKIGFLFNLICSRKFK